MGGSAWRSGQGIRAGWANRSPPAKIVAGPWLPSGVLGGCVRLCGRLKTPTDSIYPSTNASQGGMRPHTDVNLTAGPLSHPPSPYALRTAQETIARARAFPCADAAHQAARVREWTRSRTAVGSIVANQHQPSGAICTHGTPPLRVHLHGNSRGGKDSTY